MQAMLWSVRFVSSPESIMQLREEFAQAKAQWRLLTLYQKFEHACILLLSGLISIVIVFAIWNWR